MTQQETYRVFAFDLNTGVQICEIPASQLTFECRLNDAGSIGFNISLTDPNIKAVVAPFLAYDGNPVALYVDRNGTLVWGGIAQTGAYQRSSGVIAVAGKEFLSYFSQRLALRDYSALRYPGGVDPAVLLGTVLTETQDPTIGGPGSSIGVNIVAGTSNVPKYVPGYPLSQQTIVSSIINDVTTAVTPGFGGVDLQASSQYVNGLPSTTFYVKSPRAGRAAGTTGLIFDLTSALDYSWPTDATQGGNVFTVTGAGNGTATPLATVLGSAPLGTSGGQPRLDLVVSTNAQSQAQVAQMANGVAQEYQTPLKTPTVTVLTNTDQPLGTWIPGDDALLFASPGDDRFPNGKAEYWRIVAYSVTVPDAGPAQVTVTFNPPPIF